MDSKNCKNSKLEDFTRKIHKELKKLNYGVQINFPDPPELHMPRGTIMLALRISKI